MRGMTYLCVPYTLEYSTTGAGGSWKSISTEYGVSAGSGSFTWLVPDEPGANNYIKATVEDNGGKSVVDIGRNPFTITSAVPEVGGMVTVSIAAASAVFMLVLTVKRRRQRHNINNTLNNQQ